MLVAVVGGEGLLLFLGLYEGQDQPGCQRFEQAFVDETIGLGSRIFQKTHDARIRIAQSRDAQGERVARL